MISAYSFPGQKGDEFLLLLLLLLLLLFFAFQKLVLEIRSLSNARWFYGKKMQNLEGEPALN